MTKIQLKLDKVTAPYVKQGSKDDTNSNVLKRHFKVLGRTQLAAKLLGDQALLLICTFLLKIVDFVLVNRFNKKISFSPKVADLLHSITTNVER